MNIYIFNFHTHFFTHNCWFFSSVEDLSTRELGEQLNTELEISERLDSNLLNSLSSLPRQDGVGREQNSSRSPLVATAGNGGATSSEAEDYDMSEKMQVCKRDSSAMETRNSLFSVESIYMKYIYIWYWNKVLWFFTRPKVCSIP